MPTHDVVGRRLEDTADVLGDVAGGVAGVVGGIAGNVFSTLEEASRSGVTGQIVNEAGEVLGFIADTAEGVIEFTAGQLGVIRDEIFKLFEGIQDIIAEIVRAVTDEFRAILSGDFMSTVLSEVLYTGFLSPSELVQKIIQTDLDLFEGSVNEALMAPVESIDELVGLTGETVSTALLIPANIAKQIYENVHVPLAESTGAFGGLWKGFASIGLRTAFVLALPINLVFGILALVLERIKDLKILGVDVTPAFVDNAITALERLLTVDIFEAYLLSVVATALLIVAIIALALNVAPSAIPVVGNVVGLLLGVFNRVLRLFRRVAGV